MTRLFARALSLLFCLGLGAAPVRAQAPAPVEVSLAMNAPGIDFKRDLLAVGDSIRAAGAITTVPPIDDFFDPSYLAGAGR